MDVGIGRRSSRRQDDSPTARRPCATCAKLTLPLQGDDGKKAEDHFYTSGLLAKNGRHPAFRFSSLFLPPAPHAPSLYPLIDSRCQLFPAAPQDDARLAVTSRPAQRMRVHPFGMWTRQAEKSPIVCYLGLTSNGANLRLPWDGFHSSTSARTLFSRILSNPTTNDLTSGSPAVSDGPKGRDLQKAGTDLRSRPAEWNANVRQGPTSGRSGEWNEKANAQAPPLRHPLVSNFLLPFSRTARRSVPAFAALFRMLGVSRIVTLFCPRLAFIRSSNRSSSSGASAVSHCMLHFGHSWPKRSLRRQPNQLSQHSMGTSIRESDGKILCFVSPKV